VFGHTLVLILAAGLVSAGAYRLYELPLREWVVRLAMRANRPVVPTALRLPSRKWVTDKYTSVR